MTPRYVSAAGLACVTSRLAVAIMASFAVSTSAALAEGVPPVSPPVAQGSTDVPYPVDGKGDAIVVLEIVVEKDGTVSEAKVIEGAEPFAEPARQAVLGWQFAPALRGMEPVAARIRARVEFHQEPTPSPVAPAGPQTRADARTQRTALPEQAAPPAPPAEAPLDVTVRGQRRDIGQTTISAADVREMPGAFGDPFRAIEALPSVIPVVSGLPYFYIRGAPPNDNGYFVDGVRVPFLFHVGIGEAVIHPALVDHVDFFPSAAPAAYGGAAGAIVAGQTRDPAAAPHGQANLRLFDSGALVETPLDGGRGSALLAGRYGYPGPILSAITPNVKLGYWDYQGRLTWRLGKDRSIAFVLEGQNVTLSREASAMARKCMGTPTTTQCSIGEIGPITIPSVGVEAFF